MQFAKDSFYMTLRDRLAALNPARTITANGVTRPAITVAENEPVIPVEPLPDAFYLEWGAARMVEGSAQGNLMALDCVISYHTLGSCESGVDRGRTLSALDVELMHICQPPYTAKRDYSQLPSVDMGTGVSWGSPAWSEVSGSGTARKGMRLERKAELKVFFFGEGASR